VTRIVLAATELALPLLRAALTEHELLEAKTMQQAERFVLEDSIELFVIGVHFDDSRVMDLVTLIRLRPEHKKTPILVIRVTPSTMASFISQTMDAMKILQVISDYLELEGDPLAELKIKNTVVEYLPSKKRLRN
jgi:hypothetical protein